MSFATVESVFQAIEDRFDASRAGDMNAVFQFVVTGEGGGEWSVVVKDGTCTVERGSHNSPSVTLTLDSATWLKIANREMSGVEAFMGGALRVEGDILLAQEIGSLLSG